jgi:hypothetical protein
MNKLEKTSMKKQETIWFTNDSKFNLIGSIYTEFHSILVVLKSEGKQIAYFREVIIDKITKIFPFNLGLAHFEPPINTPTRTSASGSLNTGPKGRIFPTEATFEHLPRSL